MVSKISIVLCISALSIQVFATQSPGNSLNAAAPASRAATPNYIAQTKGLGMPNNIIPANNNRMAEANRLGPGINRAESNSFGSCLDRMSKLALDSFDISSLSNGGEFSVSSSSPLSPTGISAVGENLNYEGIVDLRGNMPFLGTAVFDGILPADGVAGVLFRAGDGKVGIKGEIGGSGANAAAAAAAANAGVGYGAGLVNQIGYGASSAGAGLTGSGLAKFRAAELNEALGPYGINPALAGGNALAKSLSGLAPDVKLAAPCA